MGTYIPSIRSSVESSAHRVSASMRTSVSECPSTPPWLCSGRLRVSRGCKSRRFRCCPLAIESSSRTVSSDGRRRRGPTIPTIPHIRWASALLLGDTLDGHGGVIHGGHRIGAKENGTISIVVFVGASKQASMSLREAASRRNLSGWASAARRRSRVRRLPAVAPPMVVRRGALPTP